MVKVLIIRDTTNIIIDVAVRHDGPHVGHNRERCREEREEKKVRYIKKVIHLTFNKHNIFTGFLYPEAKMNKTKFLYSFYCIGFKNIGKFCLGIKMLH